MSKSHPRTHKRVSLVLALAASVLWVACQRLAGSGGTAGARGSVAALPTWTNPVLPGDFPDPSVTRIGNTFWATATSSNWGPVFPLLRSKNLGRWELVGHVFPDQIPAWADYYFWAPEISRDHGRTYVYYTAHQRGGTLAVGVASAARPAGPYTDHGPLVSQPAGSIDGFPMRDENDRLYLIWKEDGNSVGQPTPIWAQPLNEARTALEGEKRELFRNDAGSWEGNLVEGVSMVRHGGYFYAFYAGNGCCGSACTYATGVARAKSLLGPWEKYARNPVLVNNATWQCPGHGTAVQYRGRWFLLHHAYAAASQQFVGRQGVLSEFGWTADGWPVFRSGSPPVAAAPALVPLPFTDEFAGNTLRPSWQWPLGQRPVVAVHHGQLHLTARPDHTGAALGQATTAPNYTATTTLLNPGALPAGSRAGLAAHGDGDNALALLAGGGQLGLIRVAQGRPTVLAAAPLPAAAGAIRLRLQARQGRQLTFSWSTDNGATWQQLAPGAPADGAYLPPWDQGIRVGVLAAGPESVTAHFADFRLVNEP